MPAPTTITEPTEFPFRFDFNECSACPGDAGKLESTPAFTPLPLSDICSPILFLKVILRKLSEKAFSENF
jgi:hypothetical protein